MVLACTPKTRTRKKHFNDKSIRISIYSLEITYTIPSCLAPAMKIIIQEQDPADDHYAPYPRSPIIIQFCDSYPYFSLYDRKRFSFFNLPTTFPTACLTTPPAFSTSFLLCPIVTHTLNAGSFCQPNGLLCPFAGGSGTVLTRATRTPFARHYRRISISHPPESQRIANIPHRRYQPLRGPPP